MFGTLSALSAVIILKNKNREFSIKIRVKCDICVYTRAKGSNGRDNIWRAWGEKMLEKGIESWMSKRITAMGGIPLKFVSPGNSGVPDRIYIFPGGKIYFVELKREHGRLRGLQKWQRKRFLKMGCRVYVVEGLESAKNFIKELEHDLQTT